MKNFGILRKFIYALAVFFLLIGMLPMAGVGEVFADDGATPAAGDEGVASPSGDSPVDADVEESVPAEALQDEALMEEPASEVEVQEAAVVEENAAAQESSVVAEPQIDELVELLSEEGIELADENGEPLPMGSQQAEEILLGKDPFFWNGSQWVGYTLTGSGCPANVVCNQHDYPFQKAVDEAGSGNTIYVASGNYDEDVVINTVNLSFIGFQVITVPDAAAHSLSVDASGYAVVRSLTLNVGFGTTDGVYADEVIVNGPNGRLEDGLELVNVGGTVEADVVIKAGGGYYVVQDAHDPASTEFEFECGEPDVLIYQKGTSQNPNGEYRMIFMQPTHQDIINYYTLYSPDERSDIQGALDGTPLSAQERIEDLVIGVNVSQQAGWNHTDERLIYWNLLGNMGIDANNQSTALNSGQQTKANSITDGSNDNVDRLYGLWFLWPTIQDPNNKNGKGPLPVNAFATGNLQARQLTFVDYLEPAIYGCTDPDALNYNPRANRDNENCYYRVYGCTDPEALNYNARANTDDESCTYQGESTPPPDPLAVAGAGGPLGEQFLIPVTGIDLAGASAFNLWFLAAGALLMAVGVWLRFKEEKTKS